MGLHRFHVRNRPLDKEYQDLAYHCRKLWNNNRWLKSAKSLINGAAKDFLKYVLSAPGRIFEFTRHNDKQLLLYKQ